MRTETWFSTNHEKHKSIIKIVILKKTIETKKQKLMRFSQIQLTRM